MTLHTVLFRASTTLSIALSASLIVGAASAQTITYVPNTGNSGTWHNTARWDTGVIPNAPGVNAVLNQPVSSTAGAPPTGNPATGSTYTLTLGGITTTVGSLTSNNATDAAQSFRTQFNNGSFIFDSGQVGVPAEINENLGTSEELESRMRFNVPVILHSDLEINSNHALSRNTLTEFAQRIDGAADKTITKQGLGNIQLAYLGALGETEGFFGNLVIKEGGVRMIILNASPPNTLNPMLSKAAGVTVEAGAQFQFGNGLSNVTLGPGAELKLNGTGKPEIPGLVTRDGALRFDGAGEVVCSFNSPVNLQTNARITVAAGDSSGVLTSEVRGAGRLQKSGAGLLKLNTTNIYAGGTSIINGALAVNNTIGSGVGTGDVSADGGILGGTGSIGTALDGSNVSLVGGTLAPGNLTSTLGATLPLPQLPNLNTHAGILNVAGDLTFDAASALHVDVTGATLGTQYDQVVSSGVITLGGATLNFSLGDFVPAGTETFTLINNTGAGAVMGQFGNYAQGAEVNLAGQTFFIDYSGGTGNDVVLTATVPGDEDADFDGDGDVDGADFLTWQRNLGGAGGLAQGDANGDSAINGDDLTVWKDQFGPGGASVGAVAAVPEPAALTLLGCGIAAITITWRRQSLLRS